MHSSQFLPWVLIGVGVMTAVRNVKHWRDPELLRDYIERSPKAALWRKLLGVDRTVVLTKKLFLPLGMLMSIGFVGFGAYQLLT